MFVHRSFFWHSKSERDFQFCAHITIRNESKRNETRYLQHINFIQTHTHQTPPFQASLFIDFSVSLSLAQLAQFAYSIEFECVRWKFIYIHNIIYLLILRTAQYKVESLYSIRILCSPKNISCNPLNLKSFMNTLYLNLKADNIDALLWRTHYIRHSHFSFSLFPLEDTVLSLSVISLGIMRFILVAMSNVFQ